jgi:hypothetical protein
MCHDFELQPQSIWPICGFETAHSLMSKEKKLIRFTKLIFIIFFDIILFEVLIFRNKTG